MFEKLTAKFQQINLSKKQLIYIAVLCLFALIFLISAIYLITYFVDSARQADKYNDLSSIVASIRNDLANQPLDPNKPTVPIGDGGEVDPSAILPEYRTIYEMNKDLVGWIRFEGTRIDYPVVQSPYEKDYYLYRNFNKEYSKDGCIYVREACNVFTPSDNVVIYGHRMNSGAMFADLMHYRDKSFWETHQTFSFDTIYERHTYQVISVFVTSANIGEGFSYHMFNDAANQEEFDQFLNSVHDLQLYDTGHIAQYGDMLVTLSTCTPRHEQPSNGRLVVVAKRIS